MLPDMILSGTASCFRWKAICTDAAFCLHQHARTGSCRAARVACTDGTTSRPARRSFWSKVCSTMPHCGRQVFNNVTCSLGTHLNTRQFQQLCSNDRTIWLAFDADSNGSGREAARRLAAQLKGADTTVLIVTLPDGHDPNSFFAQGGDADQFHGLLEASRP